MNTSQTCDATQSGLRVLLDQLRTLHRDFCHQAAVRLDGYAEDFPAAVASPSAINLAHYLALRSYDLRELQDRLAALGFSSLGRGEAGILNNLDRVINLLCCMLDEIDPPTLEQTAAISNESGAKLLKQHTEALLGAASPGREVRIMVTLPGIAADDYGFVKELLETGMNCARINCAHDDTAAWQRMVDHVRRAEQETGRPCRILMDLAGQKIRTSAVIAGPAVHHIKVKRDEFGTVVSPGYLRIVKQSRFQAVSAVGGFQIAIDDEVQAELETGDRLNLIDHRGKHRYLEVVERLDDDTLVTRSWKGVYLSDKTVFKLHHGENGKSHHVEIGIAGFQTAPVKIVVFKGDQLLLTTADIPGRPATRNREGELLQPAQIGISHSEVLGILKPGAAVWIDDGKIGTVVEAVTEQGVMLRVTHARGNGTQIQPDKGVNFPDTPLDLPALTDKDLQDLDFVCRHAEMVGFSFVQCKEDMQQLLRELNKRDAGHLPVVAKIETSKAVRNLPEIILSAIGQTSLGVMIARGDLAVELGSVRMAEIQEEILWLCEAAHVPVIWATQVLETLAKQGIHSRPEITDAAMSVRAECVMLNKGPYIMDALTVLNDILQRMQEHQHKKTSRLRALQQWPLHERRESTAGEARLVS